VKIAVYTIALNEERFARRWAVSAADADYRVVADTGSTDATVHTLRSLGVSTHPISIHPFRFDHARQASLDLIPEDADVCICLDLDEILRPGWRPILERAWASAPDITRLRYTFIFSWLPDGQPDYTLFQDRIHARRGYQWRYPAHEAACPINAGDERIALAPDLIIEHHPDPAKPRSSYLDLLALGTRESPADPRPSYYYGRELLIRGQYADATTELLRHLSLPGAGPDERAQSMYYLARAYAILQNLDQAERWFFAAAHECPGWRDPWVELAQVLHERKDWLGGMWAAERALAITEHKVPIGRRAHAWGAAPWDLLSTCAWFAGARAQALQAARQAAKLDPADQRLRENLAAMEQQMR
jgi:glycosyltransferase involved in cell wall biosynthesis